MAIQAGRRKGRPIAGASRAIQRKAIKEAKVNSSWINPNKHYDESVKKFIEKALSDADFLKDFGAFIPRNQALGMLNSLSQTLLKLTSPGIPEIFQGNEVWNFSLVDPDNRRPVDLDKRRQILQGLQKMQQVLPSPEDGRIKLFLHWKALRLRQKLPELFAKGSTYRSMPQGRCSKMC